MIVKKTNQPTHRVYAVRKTGQNTGYWVEIGGAWANADIHQPGRTCENCGPSEGLRLIGAAGTSSVPRPTFVTFRSDL